MLSDKLLFPNKYSEEVSSSRIELNKVYELPSKFDILDLRKTRNEK
jgi:hypothetical protein